MALVAFPNGYGTLVSPTVGFPKAVTAFGTVATLDATGESVAGIGRLYLPGGPGSSKVLSTGKLWYRATTVTFANAGSTFTAGIQDVGATGIEDGTFDVSGALTGGGGGIAANTVQSVTMNTGTKTITHGDLIAVVFELTARAGADSILINKGTNITTQLPYSTVDTGAGPAKDLSAPLFSIEFDDGTFGWLGGFSFATNVAAVTFNSGSSPDEAALIFQVPFAAVLVGVMMDLTSIAATDDFDVNFYTTPLGTPAIPTGGTITVDADLLGVAAGAGLFEGIFANQMTLAINTDYAISLRPTTVNNIGYQRLEFGTGNGNLRKVTPLGTLWRLGTRTNQTGAFTEDLTVLPSFSLILAQLSDNAGSSGGGIRLAGGGGLAVG